MHRKQYSIDRIPTQSTAQKCNNLIAICRSALQKRFVASLEGTSLQRLKNNSSKVSIKLLFSLLLSFNLGKWSYGQTCFVKTTIAICLFSELRRGSAILYPCKTRRKNWREGRGGPNGGCGGANGGSGGRAIMLRIHGLLSCYSQGLRLLDCSGSRVWSTELARKG